jgi:DNA/RNA endonuclease YhcR with UshA esterase domain
MKRIFFSIALILFSVLSFAQVKIKLEDIDKHVGDSVQVQGTISGIRYLQGARNTPTFINMGGSYPNQLLTVVIWGDVRSKMEYVPIEEKDKGSLARVSGKVELFKGKPQIVVKDQSQLQIFVE